MKGKRQEVSLVLYDSSEAGKSACADGNGNHSALNRSKGRRTNGGAGGNGEREIRLKDA